MTKEISNSPQKLAPEPDKTIEEYCDPPMDEQGARDVVPRRFFGTETPVCCLRSGLRQKDSLWNEGSWIALALTLDGRDKITKVFQYSARFLAWWFTGRSRHAERFASLKDNLTNSRKAYRLGRTFIEFYKIRSLDIHRAILCYINETSCCSPRQPPTNPLWMTIGSALKMVGLAGFWFADNVSYLATSGLFDDLRKNQSDRLARRKKLQSQASMVANRFYLFGSLVGLLTALRSYWDFRTETLQPLQTSLDEEKATIESSGGPRSDGTQLQQNHQQLEAAKGKEFTYLLAVLKSFCDVLVFSNNPGIDLWQNYRGRKLHEGIHCTAGLLSALTVLYNNFPNRPAPHSSKAE